MNALLLLLTLTSTLVLTSGERIAIEGNPVEKEGVLSFRSNGVLYSLPASEVARIEKEEPKVVIETKAETPPPRRRPTTSEERRLLLEELEKNHRGTPPPPDQKPPALSPAPTPEEVKALRREEADWRREARAYEEAVRRANEELQLIEERIEELQSKIRSLVNQGYKTHQFTYDTTQLQRALDQIPYAKLEVTRAMRANDQFREDARREGILPGWLR
ncbi:MAG TPA: hypothetical protein VEK79_07905 [Thermoanaerobaculia bacterium]|nr:hypothetical protein [Thermoanaerobaculia bacterium]